MIKNENHDLVILAGGKGTRISKYLKKYPKPMAKFFGYYFLDLIFFTVSKFLFKNIYIIAGHKGTQIKNRYDKKKINLSNIKVIVERKLKGTGGALNEIKNKIKNNFFLINGDSIFDINFFDLSKNIKKDSIGVIALVKNKNYIENKKLSSLDLNLKQQVIFNKNSKLMNGGIYFFKKKFLKLIKNNFFSLENDLLNQLIIKKKIEGRIFKNFFLDIGTPKNLQLGKNFLKKKFYKPAIFLDRDGVLNYDKGYTYKPKDLKIIGKTLQFLRKKKNYYIFIVTNQSGIARGFFNLNQFFNFQNFLLDKLLLKRIFINDFVFCPHHPQAKLIKYKKNCSCRKPNVGMFRKLMSLWPVNLKKSIFIGNSQVDRDAAQKLKIKFININDI
jgi:D-glycero-D-manno-heptose 1,7-bisphosphate phosphatase